MNLHPVCIIYCQDTTLMQRLRSFLGSMTRVQQADRPSSLLTACRQFDPAILLMDLCAADSRTLLPQVVRDHPNIIAIAVAPKSIETTSEIENAGVWAIVEPDTSRQTLQGLVQRAIAHLSVIEENRALKNARSPQPDSISVPRREEATGGASSLFHFSRAFRHFDKLETMLEHLMEGVASCARVSRVAVFAAADDSEVYRLKAGLKCLEGTDQIEFPDDDPLLCWMRMNPQLISRSVLTHLDDPSEASFLKQMLDTLGAEVIVPLHTRGRVAGWILFGRHVTGLPFDEADFEELVSLAEHVSVILENGMLYEEIRMQKTLAETLLHSMPAGIVAVDNSGKIRWFNEEAEKTLDKSAEKVMNKPVGVIGSRMGDLVIQCLRGKQTEKTQWNDPHTKLNLRLQTRRLADGDTCMGAVLIIHDMTEDQRLREKQDRIERAAFWTELAAAISHEVRNPLVAISTFAQLLPERYDDPEFRENFSGLAQKEISRVNHLLNQLDSFANQPDLNFKPLSIDVILRKSLDLAKSRVPFNGTSVKMKSEPSLPTIQADEASLIDCFAHLIANSVEATEGKTDASVSVSAKAAGGDNGNRTIRISVEDNGIGIPLDISDKIFSPFCSVKAHGIGLGLPIVKRTVTDHNGKVSIETGDTGTSVSVELPVSYKLEELQLQGV